MLVEALMASFKDECLWEDLTSSKYECLENGFLFSKDECLEKDGPMLLAHLTINASS